MCMYCAISNHMFKFDPPWRQIPSNPWHDYIPQPVVPTVNPPWSIDRLKEFHPLLARVKRLEDQLGCECDEPNKPDYIKLVEERISQLEKRTENQSK